MTANELADNLYEIYTNTDYEEFKLSANMLRQQQAELDAFNLNIYNLGYSLQLKDKDETIKQQQAEIEALKLRELTDEEILELAPRQSFGNWGNHTKIQFARAVLKCASGNILINKEVKD
jgi:hypothetical protein